ncbi:hypothetical protein B6412_002762 [Salmonella enterica]|nr:hypothetical protein [Salmonella enterica]
MTTNNHPANGPVSLDRLHQIREHLQHDTQYSNGGNRAYILSDVLKVIDGAIAAFGAEPVAWRYRYVHTPKTEEHGSPFTTEWKLCDSEDECNPSDCFERQPLYTAPPAPVSVPDAISTRQAIAKMESHEPCDSINVAYKFGWNACRSAMLQTGNSPVTPDGYVLVPKKLTAENGAKSVLSGEFSETKFINCPECFGDDDCETCDGSGRIEITVPVTWTTIKDIWAKGVEHFAAAPQQEVK